VHEVVQSTGRRETREKKPAAQCAYKINSKRRHYENVYHTCVSSDRETVHESKRADVAAYKERDIKPARVTLDGDGPDVAAEDRAEAARERDDALPNAICEADERRRRHCDVVCQRRIRKHAARDIL